MFVLIVAVSVLTSNASRPASNIIPMSEVLPSVKTCSKLGVKIGGRVTQATPSPVLVST